MSPVIRSTALRTPSIGRPGPALFLWTRRPHAADRTYDGREAIPMPQTTRDTRPGAAGPSLSVWAGDITRLAVDAVVNAANERMLGGGGVDGAIHRAAGPDLLMACRDVPEVRPGVRCPTGEARLTPGYRLPARFVDPHGRARLEGRRTRRGRRSRLGVPLQPRRRRGAPDREHRLSGDPDGRLRVFGRPWRPHRHRDDTGMAKRVPDSRRARRLQQPCGGHTERGTR